MIERYGLLIAFALCAVWSGLCGWIGYSMRDGRCDATEAKAEVVTQTARAEVVEKTRETDHANAQKAASVERQRIEAERETEVIFQAIEKKANEYASANPGPSGCELDGDGLHAWSAANAGQFPASNGPIDSAGSARALSGKDPATVER